MSVLPDIRPSPIAGTWYSADPERLRQQIDQYLRPPDPVTLEGEVIALIAPHAGHRYSGRTAGYAFASVLGQERDLVVIAAPMHAGYPATLLTTAHRAYSTPLGPVWVDQKAIERLEEVLMDDGLSLTPIKNDPEHSVEIELPFLQRALRGEFLLLPVMIRSMSPLVARRLGHALAVVVQERIAQPGRGCLLVASTDLSHFYPDDLARKLDHEMLRRIRNFAPDDLFNAERTGKGFACGLSAVAAVLWAARELGANQVEILHYSTSADETGDRSSVVGYGAAAVLKHA